MKWTAPAKVGLDRLVLMTATSRAENGAKGAKEKLSYSDKASA
jgi:hypothetical protein